MWFVATPTKPPAVDFEDEPVTGALSASSVKLPPAMIQPEWPPEPTEAELLLVVVVSARAVPTPTKPPVAFFEFALVLVCEFDLIVTSAPAVTRSASIARRHVLRDVRRRRVVADADEAAAGAVRVGRRHAVAGRRVEEAERHAAGPVEALLRGAAGAVGRVRRGAGQVDAEIARAAGRAEVDADLREVVVGAAAEAGGAERDRRAARASPRAGCRRRLRSRRST